MAKLVLHGKEGALREFSLDRQRLTIGRHSENDICIADKAASAEHAAIITIGRNSYLQDLESTNGTLVNGAPVQKHTLKHGDVILIGRSHLSYVEEAAASEKAEKSAEAPMVVDPTERVSVAPTAVLRADKPAGKMEATLDALDRDYQPWAESEEDKNKDLVERAIDAIRSHRDSERTLQMKRRERLEQEWQKLLEVAESLKKRLVGNPRVRFFDISRNKSDIMIRVAKEHGQTGQQAILISRQHPHTPSPHETIWYIETGKPDKHYDNAEEITREMMRTLAPLIS